MTSDVTETRPNLGRTAKIGEIYDIRTDSLTRINVFKRDIPEQCCEPVPNNNMHTEFHISNKTSDKLKKLDIHGEIALGILSGLVFAGGSAKVIYEKKTKKKEVQCCFILKATSYDEFINFQHEALKDCYVDKIPDGGTHFVVGRSWGANAIVTFTYENSDDLNETQIEGKLKLDLDKLKTCINGHGEISANYHRNFEILSNEMKIVANADVSLNHEGASMTLEDALEFIKKLPNRISETKGRQLILHLMPITTLKQYLDGQVNNDFVYHHIGPGALQRMQNLFDNIEEAEEEITNLLNVAHDANYLTSEDVAFVENYYKDFNAAVSELRSKVKNLLKTIRSGDRKEGKINEGEEVYSSDDLIEAKTTFEIQSLKQVRNFINNSAIGEKQQFYNDLETRSIQYIKSPQDLTHWKVSHISSNSNAYMLFASFKNDRNDENWSKAIEIFFRLCHEKLENTSYIFIDKDMFPDVCKREKIPDGICICNFRSGIYISHDILEKYFQDQISVAKLKPELKLAPNLISNRKRTSFVAPCPNSYQGLGCRSMEHSWLCRDCDEYLEYGLDNRFYCGCGNENAQNYLFKCADEQHGMNYVSYREEILKHLIKNINPNQEINILLIGETGVGKSTWINLVPNYLKYEKIEDAINGSIETLISSKFCMTKINEDNSSENVCITVNGTCENEDGRVGVSQTKNPKTYQFKVGNLTYNIIDTPGIGDTDGILNDQINMEKILNHISQYEQIHGICFFLQPNIARATTFFQFCMKSLFTQFHKIATENIVFCFTNTYGHGFQATETVIALNMILKQCNIDIPLTESTLYYYDNISYRYLCSVREPYEIKFSSDQQELYARSYAISRKETLRLMQNIKHQRPYNTKNSLSLFYARRILAQLTIPLVLMTINIESWLDKIINFVTNLVFKNKYSRIAETLIIDDVIDFQLDTRICCEACCESHPISVEQVWEETTNMKLFPKLMEDYDFLMCFYSDQLRKSPYIFKEYQDIQVNGIGREFCPKCESKFKKIKVKQRRIVYNETSSTDAKTLQIELNEEHEKLFKATTEFANYLSKYSLLAYYKENDTIENYVKMLIEKEKMGAVKDPKKIVRLEEYLTKYKREIDILKNPVKCNNIDRVTSQIEMDTEKIHQTLEDLKKLKHRGNTIKNLIQMELDHDNDDF